MKEYVTTEEFQAVLALLGLPGQTVHIELCPREELMAGVASSWRMRAVIADSPGLPYTTRTVHVPVMLPGERPGAQGYVGGNCTGGPPAPRTGSS